MYNLVKNTEFKREILIELNVILAFDIEFDWKEYMLLFFFLVIITQ